MPAPSSSDNAAKATKSERAKMTAQA